MQILSTVFPWHSNCISRAGQHGRLWKVKNKSKDNFDIFWKVNMTSTATIVANTAGNFIIEANLQLNHSLLYFPIFLCLHNQYFSIVWIFWIFFQPQGGAVLRNSTGDLAIVWEEKRQIAFSVTNWLEQLQKCDQIKIEEIKYLTFLTKNS